VQSGASVKRTVGGISEAVEVDGVLWGQRWWRDPGKAVEVEGEVIQWHRGQRGQGDDMLRG
jgi:hypothetical protein